MKYLIIISLVTFTALLFSISLAREKVSNFTTEIVSEIHNDSPKVTTKSQIDEIFDKFTQIKGRDLSKPYKKETLLSAKKFKYATKGRKYYLVPKSMLHVKILGNNRIRDIVSPGHQREGDFIPLLLDKRVLYKYIDLYKTLKRKGYNPDNIQITSGHRHPAHNEELGGAHKSTHILGQALDFDVGDINNNGVANMEDKMIVYKLLDKKIIKNKGGLGKYSFDPHALHMDVRGWRGRWDSFKR